MMRLSILIAGISFLTITLNTNPIKPKQIEVVKVSGPAASLKELSINKLSTQIKTQSEFAKVASQIPADLHCELAQAVLKKNPFGLDIALFLLNKYCGANFKLIPTGGDKYATLNITEIEPITKDDFNSLIQDRIQEELPFILAMATTKINGSPIIHYFDAASLNRYLFGGHLNPGTNLPPIASKTNPINRQPLEQIQYYILYPFKKAFELLGQYNDLALLNSPKGGFMSAHFTSYAQEPVWSGYIALGESYQSGKYDKVSIPVDNEKSIYFFKLATQSPLPYWRGDAQLKLAEIYRHGLGNTPADLARAKSYYEQAAASLTEFESQNPGLASQRSSTMIKNATAKAQELNKQLAQ